MHSPEEAPPAKAFTASATPEAPDPFADLCLQLLNFGSEAPPEWADGFLAAVAAAPLASPASRWVPDVFGDSFERCFADPASAAQAQLVLQARLDELRRQLDAGALLDRPDELRLEPWIAAADETNGPPAGTAWAEGFLGAIEAMGEEFWPVPDHDAARDELSLLLSAVVMLAEPADSPALQDWLKTTYRGETPDRDTRIDHVCFAVQDLRVFYLDHPPKPATLRVEQRPGRNDPCPCGSGLKFKKCHGA